MTEKNEHPGKKGKFGIIVSGGPAPGINCVIASSVIEAANSGYEVIGFQNGFLGASGTDPKNMKTLTPDIINAISSTGGSYLGTSRFNPLAHKESEQQLFQNFSDLGVDKLIVIGGEGSAFLSHSITRARPDLQVVHVPKTIDNDLVLPNNYVSFGFETARYVGSHIIETLRVDAKTCGRWYLAVTMGRQAGFLALGIGITSEAPLTLIPEEFSDRLYSPKEVAKLIFRSIQKRHAKGRPYGVAVLAEGILDRLDPESSPILKNCPRDELGRITYSEIELGDVILPDVTELCREAGIDIAIKTKDIGYELRCARPIAFDLEYTKFLGYGAVRHLLDGKTGIVVTRDYDNLGYETLESISANGKMLSRTVSLTSDFYLVGRSFMIR